MLLMLPKGKSPVVWDPTFPRDGVSMPGSANHSFCPPPVARTISEWNKGFDDWWKKLHSSSPASQVWLPISEPVRFVISDCFPFFFWLLAKLHSKRGLFSARQKPQFQLHALRSTAECQELFHTSPGSTYFWPTLLLGRWGWEGRKEDLTWPTDDLLKL